MGVFAHIDILALQFCSLVVLFPGLVVLFPTLVVLFPSLVVLFPSLVVLFPCLVSKYKGPGVPEGKVSCGAQVILSNARTEH